MAHTRARSGGRNRRGRNNPAQYGGWLMFARPEQHWFFRVLGLVLRYRAELTAITVLVIVYRWLDRHVQSHIMPTIHTWTGQPVPLSDPSERWVHTETLLIMAAGVLILMIVPVSRRYVIRRCWCVIARHRVRACMVQMFTMARANGRMPFLLWSRPSSTGEHLTVWLPAGLAVKDLERITDHLAAACWAKQVHVVASEWRASLAHVYIGRHELLNRVHLAPDADLEPGIAADIHTADGTFGPNLTDHRTGRPTKTTGNRHLYPVRNPAEESASLAALTPALRRPDDGKPTPAPTTVPTDSPPASPAKSPAATAAPAAPTSESPSVTGYGGHDVSDYI